MSKASEFNWFKIELLQVANDLMDVKSMDGEGAYFRMLRFLWMNGPQTKAEIERRCKDAFNDIEHVFNVCSTDDEQLLSIRWLEDQREKAETGREKWRKAGEASAAARRAKSTKKNKRSPSVERPLNICSTNDEQTSNECSTSVEHSTSTSTSISYSNQDSGKKERADEIYPTDFPAELRTPEMLSAWMSWERHRKEKRQALTPSTRSQQLKICAGWGAMRSIAAIEHTIGKGWTGLFEPKNELGTHAATIKSANPNRHIPATLQG